MEFFYIENKVPFSTNTFLLVSSKGNAAVIDPACSAQTYNDILTKKGAKLTHILLTHGHYDHTTSVVQLKKQHGAGVYLGNKDIKEGAEHLFNLTRQDYDFEYVDGQIIEIDDIKIKVITTPGHSNGSVCLYIEDEELLFTGDTLFKLEIGRCDFKGSDYSKMLKSLKKLKDEISKNPKVLPGHDEFSTLQFEISNNPYFKKI